jgi:hypothetical protein
MLKATGCNVAQLLHGCEIAMAPLHYLVGAGYNYVKF